MKVKIDQETVEAIKNIVSEQKDEPDFVRIFVAGYACSGPQFGLALDDKKEGDLVDDSNSVAFIIEKDLDEQFGEITIESMGEGFIVRPSKVGPSSCCSCSGCH